jgi:hypothetical protein
MTTVELRSNFHKLIDNTNNDSVLSKFYELLSKANEERDGELWAGLSYDEQQELLEIEKESHDITLLISHSEMFQKHKKWL